MSKLRRYNSEGKDYFITCVTYDRIPILIDNVNELWKAIDYAKAKLRFQLTAWVILPDHLHIMVDPLENYISQIVRRIKLKFSGLYRSKKEFTGGRVWQHRFWDHIIRDEDDLRNHLDYIHYNPVKHGLVGSPFEYEHSSARKYLANGYYQSDWGNVEPVSSGETFGE